MSVAGTGRRIAILAEGRFAPLTAKTACCVIRYRGPEVVAVLDSTRAGRTAGELIGYGGAIPVVRDLQEALRRRPDTLLIGIAPKGGLLPAAWRTTLLEAIEAGLEIWSGLHSMLADDADLAAAAGRRGVRLWDIRRPPDDLNVPTGALRKFPGLVAHTVGTDCDVGKMTVAVELTERARARGVRAAFAATGQTGIVLAGRGIVVDRVVSDFVSGATERLVLEAGEGMDLVVVEGQGTLTHPAYSGVTLGLLHGAMADALVLCHHPGRETLWGWGEEARIPPIREQIRLWETMAALVKPAPVVAIALNTFDSSEAEARDLERRIESETGLPCVDPIRSGSDRILDAVLRRGEKLGKGPRAGSARSPT